MDYLQLYLIIGTFFGLIGGCLNVKAYQKMHPQLQKNEYHTKQQVMVTSAKLGAIYLIAGLIIMLLYPLWIIELIIAKKKGKLQ